MINKIQTITRDNGETKIETIFQGSISHKATISFFFLYTCSLYAAIINESNSSSSDNITRLLRSISIEKNIIKMYKFRILLKTIISIILHLTNDKFDILIYISYINSFNYLISRLANSNPNFLEIKEKNINSTKKLEIIRFHARKDRYFKLSFDYIPVIGGQKFAKSWKGKCNRANTRSRIARGQVDGRFKRETFENPRETWERERENCERERVRVNRSEFSGSQLRFHSCGARKPLKSEIYIPSVVKVSWTIKKSKWGSWKEKTPNYCTCTREGTELFGIFDPCIIRVAPKGSNRHRALRQQKE